MILPDVCRTRDSIGSMAVLLDLLAAAGEPLSVTVAGLPRYVMIKHRFELDERAGDAVAPAVQRVARRFADEDVNTDDGVRVDVEDGWVHLRPSNTEPIVRLIAEAESESEPQVEAEFEQSADDPPLDEEKEQDVD